MKTICPFMSTPEKEVECKENCRLNSAGVCSVESTEYNTYDSKQALEEKLDAIIERIDSIK